MGQRPIVLSSLSPYTSYHTALLHKLSIAGICSCFCSRDWKVPTIETLIGRTFLSCYDMDLKHADVAALADHIPGENRLRLLCSVGLSKA